MENVHIVDEPETKHTRICNGISTAVQHREYFNIDNPLISIYRCSYVIHPLQLGKKWKFIQNRPYAKKQPFVIRAGEGTGRISFNKINQLIRRNLIQRKLIAVHGVAITTQQAKVFEALIWRPDPNMFFLHETGRLNELKSNKNLFWYRSDFVRRPESLRTNPFGNKYKYADRQRTI